jgi:hypothetical protein
MCGLNKERCQKFNTMAAEAVEAALQSKKSSKHEAKPSKDLKQELEELCLI